MRDVTVVHVPQNCMHAVTGVRGQALRSIEEETGAFCFIARDHRKEEQLFIFGCAPSSAWTTRPSAQGPNPGHLCVIECLPVGFSYQTLEPSALDRCWVCDTRTKRAARD